MTLDDDQMKKPAATLITAVPLAAALATQAMGQQSASLPPVARKVPHTTNIHGYTLSDDYFWLREKANPDVTAYLEAENAYTEEVMRPTKALQDTLYKEMLGRIKQTDLSVPSRIGEYFYYSRTEEGKQYPFMCRRQGSMTGAEEVVLDLNQLAEGHKFLGLGAYAVSDDANWLAYSLDTNGYRQYVLRVRDLRTGRDSAERIERAGSVVWATDNKTLVYTTEDAVSKRSDKVFRHTVGAAASELIFEERDELFDVSAGRSLDKKMIFVTSGAKTSTEVRYLPASTPAAPLTIVLPRQPGHEYTSITTTASSTSPPTRARRTSRSSRHPSPIRPSGTGRPSSSTSRACASGRWSSSHGSWSSPSARAASATCASST